MIRLQKIAGLLFLGLFLATLPSNAHAAFNPNRIIEDNVFTNKNTMSPQAIQAFLNSKVAACDTNRTGGTGSQGEQPPWRCLRDYHENPTTKANNLDGRPIPAGGISAAQIIYDAAQKYGVNPQVIIVTLQKENGLITDTWPYDWQYRTAMGMGCPDGAPCDAQYFGFANQVDVGTKHLRNFFDQNPNWFIPHRAGPNNVKFHPDAARCGSSGLNINKATSALYSYTPYQPNAAALGNLYGTGDSCSSYGNRNFWRDFTAWFPQIKVIQQEGGNRLYLEEGGVNKRWIPSPDVLNAWGLNNYPIEVVSTPYFNSLPELAGIQRVVSTTYATYFMDGGTRHWITSKNVAAVWGIDVDQAVRTADYTIEAIPESTPLQRFAQSTDTSDGRVWLMDVGIKHYVPDQDTLTDWSYDALIKVSPAYLDTKATGGQLGKSVIINGTVVEVVNGKPYSLSAGLVTAWGASNHTAMNIDPFRFLPPIQNGSLLVQNVSDGKIYVTSNGTLHYISDQDTLTNWGYNGQNITALTASRISEFTQGGSAAPYLVQDANGKVYILDGRKRYVSTSPLLHAWAGSNPSIPTYGNSTLEQLIGGPDANYLVQAVNDGRVFTLDSGSKRLVPDQHTLSAWGYPERFAIERYSPSLLNKLATSANASRLLNDGSTSHILDGGYRHSITPPLYSTWGVNQPQATSSATVSRFEDGGAATLTVRLGNDYYLMNGGTKVWLGSQAITYGASTNSSVLLRSDYPSSFGTVSFLAQSTDPADGRVYFINQGGKQYVDSVQKLQALGQSSGIGIVRLVPATLAAIPENSTILNPLLIKRSDSGTGLAVGYGLFAFPNSETLNAWLGTRSALNVSPGIFNSFTIRGTVSRTVQGSDGKVYFIENGQKRWITSQNAFNSYRNYGVVRLPDYTLDLVPTGSPIN